MLPAACRQVGKDQVAIKITHALKFPEGGGKKTEGGGGRQDFFVRGVGQGTRGQLVIKTTCVVYLVRNVD